MNAHVFAWAADKPWAKLITSLLNRVEAEGLCRLLGTGGEGDAGTRKTRLGPQVDRGRFRISGLVEPRNRPALVRTACGMPRA